MIIFANVKRRWAEILAVLCVCTAWGQSTIGDMPMFRYNFNQDLKSKVLPLPATVNPALRPTLPTPGMTRQPEPLKLDYRLSHIADSMPQVTSAGYLTTPPPPQYDFHGNPYARDWASSGVIAHVGTGYISGAGSYTSYPAMGTIGSATLAITQPIGDRFTITAGITGNKYHFGREAWNDFGISGRASYMLNDRLTLNAFGQYYLDPRFHSMGSYAYIPTANYGGTLGIKMSDNFSLDVGAQRYYDAYSHTWRTVPILAPTFKLFGAPISVDLGGIIYQVLYNLLHSYKSGSNNNYYNVAGPQAGSNLMIPTGPSPMGRMTRDLTP